VPSQQVSGPDLNSMPLKKEKIQDIPKDKKKKK
jgi:hypothetical protein